MDYFWKHFFSSILMTRCISLHNEIKKRDVNKYKQRVLTWQADKTWPFSKLFWPWSHCKGQGQVSVEQYEALLCACMTETQTNSDTLAKSITCNALTMKYLNGFLPDKKTPPVSFIRMDWTLDQRQPVLIVWNSN